jgi:glucokinase
MMSDSKACLLGDIGGTHARFAWQDQPGGALAHVATYLCTQHDSLLAAMQHYLDEHQKPVPRRCAIGIANPITGDDVRMTNHHWSFSISAIQRQLGLEQLAVINDFTALALSLPALPTQDLRQVGGELEMPRAPKAVIGPGTGLGVSGLLPHGDQGWLPINGEGGHATLAATDDLQAAILAQMRRRFGHVSAERALSGPGLVNLYEAACALAGQPARSLGPAEVIAGANSGADHCCETALDLFCSFLGSVAGNLALTLGAHGGVYIGGGIAPRLTEHIRRSAFRKRFEDKGRFGDYLAKIPVFIIDAAISPAFVGAARALDMAHANTH